MKKVFSEIIDWEKEAPITKIYQLEEDLGKLNSWKNKGEKIIENTSLADLSDIDKRRLFIKFQSGLGKCRAHFVAIHGLEIYLQITNNWQIMYRLKDFVDLVSVTYPGLVSTKEEIQSDYRLSLQNKKGYEISQGLIIGEFLAIPSIGKHLMAAMRMPKADALLCLKDFLENGKLKMETIQLERVKNVGYLTISNPKSLNAEDDTLNHEMELAVDLILLDPSIDVGVMRGDYMKHSKYQNKRVFCSGINLTKLYAGEIPYMFYVERELGLMSKIFRGLFSDEFSWDQSIDIGIEKPWITAVDSHAIGGGCQLVLISDFVIADPNAYFTIPARSEGFIPGLANFRLNRYMGLRLASKMINLNYKVMADSPDGNLLIDQVVKTNAIETEIDRIVQDICKAGIQGMISNRKAFRIGTESLETFRLYMSMFSREQVRCMYDNEIIENLEAFWINKYKETN